MAECSNNGRDDVCCDGIVERKQENGGENSRNNQDPLICLLVAIPKISQCEVVLRPDCAVSLAQRQRR